MLRAIISVVMLWLMGGLPLLYGQDTGDRRPDIKINRERRDKGNRVPKEKIKKPDKQPITDEDAEVIENLELLQNLDLLQEYDKVSLLNLLAPNKQKARIIDAGQSKDQVKKARSDEKNSKN